MRLFIKAISYTLLGLIALFLLVVLSLPLTLPPLASHLARDQGIDLSIEKLSIAWFDTAVRIEGLAVSAVEGSAVAEGSPVAFDKREETLTLGAFEVRLATTKLLRNKEIHLEVLSVEDIYLPITAFLSDKNQLDRLVVANIDINQFTQKSDETTQEKESVANDEPAVTFLGWESIKLRNIDVQAQLQRQNRMQLIPLTIRSAEVGELRFDQVASSTPLDLALSFNGSAIKLKGKSAPLAEQPSAKIALRIQDTHFEPWAQLADFLDVDLAPVNSASGELQFVSNIEWLQAGENHRLTLSDAELSVVNLSLLLASKGDGVETKQATDMTGEFDLSVNELSVQTAPMQYRVGELLFASKVFNFQDANLDPPLNVAVKDLKLELDVIDSNSNRASIPSQLNLSTLVGSYGKVFVSAKGNFLDERVDGKINAQIEELNLPSLSGLAKGAIGKHIDKGALDFEYNAEVKQNQLDSKALIEAHQLGLSGDYASQSNIVEELGMPLNAALNLLRDKDDTVRLSVPVNGDLNDPQVRIGKVVNKALLNGLKTAVVTQFGPLLALSALDKAKDMATALKLKPVIFASQATAIETVERESIDRLETIANLLEKRPKIKINVCGVALVSEVVDAAVMNDMVKAQSVADKPEQKQEPQSFTLDLLKPEQKTALYDLANARAEAAKDYFIGKSLEGNRIILCAPTVASGSDDLPSVKFSL